MNVRCNMMEAAMGVGAAQESLYYSIQLGWILLTEAAVLSSLLLLLVVKVARLP